MFIQMLQTDPVYYFTAVVTLIFSIVLHELAHGWAAISRGDDTPRVLGHMTPNPVTHMGAIGFVAVFILGMGWGAMPISPSRLRGKHAEAFVAAAGPAMNLGLAIVALTTFALLLKPMMSDNMSEFQMNMINACLIFGVFNLVLVLLNLIPVPPLDGSRILGDFSMQYRNWLRETEQHHLFMLLGLFVLLGALERSGYGLFSMAGRIAGWYIGLFA